MVLLFKEYADHRDHRVLTHALPRRGSPCLVLVAEALAAGREAPVAALAQFDSVANGQAPRHGLAEFDRRAIRRRDLEVEPGQPARQRPQPDISSEEHTSEPQSLMRISYAVFCLNKKTHKTL